MKKATDRQVSRSGSGTAPDGVWDRLQARLTEYTPRDSQNGSVYREYDTPNYHRGSFINTECNVAQVHSYSQMESLLRDLQIDYPSDVAILSAGRSQGYGGYENALDVWVLHMPATESPTNTAFFIAGHHPEFSGPETAYLLAERLLKSYHSGNENVKSLRRNTHLVFIPQVDADLFDNLDRLASMSQEDYYEQGYSWILSDPDHSSSLRGHDMNLYVTDNGMTEEEYINLWGHRPFAQTVAAKRAVLKAIEACGKPEFAFDYHENCLSDRFTIIPIGSSPPYYALAEVAKSYPVEGQDDVEATAKSRREVSNGSHSLIDIISDMGAAGFTFEAPGKKPVYRLEKSIEMNLIATDRILSRHCLDI